MVDIDGLDDVWSEPDEKDNEIVLWKYGFLKYSFLKYGFLYIKV